MVHATRVADFRPAVTTGYGELLRWKHIPLSSEETMAELQQRYEGVKWKVGNPQIVPATPDTVPDTAPEPSPGDAVPDQAPAP